MARSAKANAIQKRRQDLRDRFWPEEIPWEAEKGFMQAPRTLPLLMRLLDTKAVSGKMALGQVYLELWSRHMGDSLIEMDHEEDHAYAAGYRGTSAVRRWRERMDALDALGFIRVRPSGLRKRAYVFLRPPPLVVGELNKQGKVPADWLATYEERQIKVGEPRLVDFQPKPKAVGGSPFDLGDDDLPF